jgi:hypothetical protein
MMKKIFQTIVDKGHGNCMQAAVASLLELELNDVPNFIVSKTGVLDLMKFLFKYDYDCTYINRRGDQENETEFLKSVAKFDGGVNGYFYASVPSQTYEGVYHAVIVDTDLNIVHDPNPNQLALKLTADDVVGFYCMHSMVIGKTGKLFTKEEWDNTTEEERDANTHKHNLNVKDNKIPRIKGEYNGNIIIDGDFHFDVSSKMFVNHDIPYKNITFKWCVELSNDDILLYGLEKIHEAFGEKLKQDFIKLLNNNNE